MVWGTTRTRAELLEAERARRQELRERRAKRSIEAIASVMSQGERNQRAQLALVLARDVRRLIDRRAREERLRGVVAAVDGALLAASVPAAVRVKWRDSTWDEVKEHLRAAGPAAGPATSAFLVNGLVSLPQETAQHLDAVLGDDLERVSQPASTAWSVARGLGRVIAGRAPGRDDLEAMARSHDLAIVDSALDLDPSLGAVARTVPRGGEELDYLTARTDPVRLDTAAVLGLGWTEEARRRAFVGGGEMLEESENGPWRLRRRLLDGDLSALAAARRELADLTDVIDDIESLPPDELVRRHASDGSLWRALDAAVGGSTSSVGAQPFDTWRALTRARAALLRDDVATAAAHMRSTRPDRAGDGLTIEFHNVALYCAVMSGDDRRARSHLKVLERRATSSAARLNIETARTALARLADGDSRAVLERFESPWLVLGLDEPEDERGRAMLDRQWVTLQKLTRSDKVRRIRVNQARQRLKSDPKTEPHFVVPLVRSCYAPPLRGRLVPPPTTLARRTPLPSRETWASWRARAWSLAVSAALDEARPTDLWQELRGRSL